MSKKITLLAFVVAAMAITSCKKDHTCTCTVTDSSGGSTVHTIVVKNSTKKALKSGRCYNGTLTATFSGFSFAQNQACTIK